MLLNMKKKKKKKKKKKEEKKKKKKQEDHHPLGSCALGVRSPGRLVWDGMVDWIGWIR